jgi:hypothetical protein
MEDMEDIKTSSINDLKNEPIIITLPYKWGDEVYFMDNNLVHIGKILGFTCYGQFGGVFITSYDISESYGDMGRRIKIDSDFVFATKEELIKNVLGTF